MAQKIIVLDDLAFSFLADKLNDMPLSGREVASFLHLRQLIEYSMPLHRQSWDEVSAQLAKMAGVTEIEEDGQS